MDILLLRSFICIAYLKSKSKYMFRPFYQTIIRLNIRSTFPLRAGQRIFVHNVGSKTPLKFKVIQTVMKFLPSFVSILLNLKQVTMNIFVVRKHFYKLAESSEVFDVIMFTDNKPLRFYILVNKEYQVNIPEQGFQASE